MRWPSTPTDPVTTDPATRVRQAVSSLRTVGTVLILAAAVLAACVLPAVGSRGIVGPTMLTTRAGRAVDLAAAVVLVGPGVLYHLTAVLIRRRDVAVALLARRTAVVQCGVAVAAVAAVWAGRAFGHGGPVLPALVPSAATIFFVPALLAQAVEIGSALNALRHLPDARRGFEVRPQTPVLPAE